MNDLITYMQECETYFHALWPEDRRTLVFGDGNTVSPDIMLIGEAPGERETLEGRPFVGKAGKNLADFLHILGMHRSRLYVSNVVKVRPITQGPTGRVRNRPPTREEINAFLPWLNREIALVQPRTIVTLGNVPLKALLNPSATVGTLHGTWHTTGNGIPLFALYHPAAIIYRRELKQVYEKDVLTLRDTLTFQTQK